MWRGELPPPNTRMQRTRSSPTARHSPLMRCPLGGLWLFTALGIAVGCGSVKNSIRSGGCVAQTGFGDAALLKVVVEGPAGCTAFAYVTAYRPGDPEAAHFGVSPSETAGVPMPLGLWEVEAVIDNDTIVRTQVELSVGSLCTVTVFAASRYCGGSKTWVVAK